MWEQKLKCLKREPIYMEENEGKKDQKQKTRRKLPE